MIFADTFQEFSHSIATCSGSGITFTNSEIPFSDAFELMPDESIDDGVNNASPRWFTVHLPNRDNLLSLCGSWPDSEEEERSLEDLYRSRAGVRGL